MKFTKSQFKQIIKEEMGTLVPESDVSEEALFSINSALNDGDIVFAEKLAGQNPDAIAVIDHWKEKARAAAEAEREAPPTPEDKLPEPYYAIPPRSGPPPGNVSEQELKRFINEEIDFIMKEGILDAAKGKLGMTPKPGAVETPDDSKLNRKTMAKGQSVAGAKGALAGDSDELSNPERGIIQQLIEFLLKIAQTPGVEFQLKRPIIQKVMKILQTRIMQGVEVNNDG
jgi:hypothetical protein